MKNFLESIRYRDVKELPIKRLKQKTRVGYDYRGNGAFAMVHEHPDTGVIHKVVEIPHGDPALEFMYHAHNNHQNNPMLPRIHQINILESEKHKSVSLAAVRMEKLHHFKDLSNEQRNMVVQDSHHEDSSPHKSGIKSVYAVASLTNGMLRRHYQSGQRLSSTPDPREEHLHNDIHQTIEDIGYVTSNFPHAASDINKNNIMFRIGEDNRPQLVFNDPVFHRDHLLRKRGW